MGHGLRKLVLVALCIPLVLSVAGCWTRVRKEVLQDKEGLKVILRSQTRGGDPIDKGFQHPITISGVRLANALSRIEVRTNDEEEGRKPAIDATILFEIGDVLAAGLAKADSTQEVVVMAVKRSRRFGVFTDEKLTSFVAFVKDDRLVVQLSRIDWTVPKSDKQEALPEPNPEKPAMRFRVVPTDGMQSFGPQGVAIDWRAPQFKAGGSVRVTPTGKVVRKTILMETAPEDPGAEDEAPLPTNLAPATLRRLADLEESRRRGEMTESEYSAQRNEILRSDPGASPARSREPGPADEDE